MSFKTAVSEIIKEGLENDVFPCAAYAIGNQTQILTKGFVGNSTLYPQRELLNEDTLFDMASLSKLISTTMIALKAIELGKISLNDKLEAFLNCCYDKSEITIEQLLTHTSGLPSHIPLWTKNINPDASLDFILKTPFDYKSGNETVYSCMGYIVLQKVLEQVFEKPLEVLAKELVFDPLDMKTACYCPTTKNCVSTEYTKDLDMYAKGIVHDENARFMRGIAGNAGVFCTLNDTIQFATMLSNRGKDFLSDRMFEKAIKNHTPGKAENRGLGFVLSCDAPTFMGDLFSYGSYGHTGFTGTSIAVDNDTGLYAILLTNRVHFGRENDKIIRFRRSFHNVIWGNI